MTEEIDSTIQSVERLYRAVSGREANGVESAPIPPERDATKHVDEQLDRLLSALARVPRVLTPTARPELPAWAPPVSIFSSKEDVWVCVDVPGVARELLTVTATQHALVVAGSRAAPFAGTARVSRAESPLGTFRREIALPPDVDLNAITASLKDGVLEIRAPRSERPAPRPIDVQ